MILKIKHFVAIITIIGFTSCSQNPKKITEIEAQQLLVDSTFATTDEIEKFIAPYRKRVNIVLDSTLAYAPKTITKMDGFYNSSAGNLMADIVLSEGNPIFKSRTGNDIDFVQLNHGGIRSVISAGKVTARNAYEIMPFENTIVVAELPPASVLEMIHYLIKSKRAHPVAGIQIILNQNGELDSFNFEGKAFDSQRNYFVATSNYLVTGGDNMGFFRNVINVTDTDYLIRNAMIDYFKKVDTLKAEVDDRFYKLN